MKKHVQITFVKRCYFCPNMRANSKHTSNNVMRKWTCKELERVIDEAELFLKPERKYRKPPLLHQKGWFPDWCPLEEIKNVPDEEEE